MADNSGFVEDMVCEDSNLTESGSDGESASDSPVYSFRNIPASVLQETAEEFERLGAHAALSQAQDSLFQVMSGLNNLRTELLAAQEEKERYREAIEKTKEEMKRMAELHVEALAAKDKETESLKKQISARKTGIEELKRERERLEKQLELAPRLAYAVTRWEMIQQWKRGEADKWDVKQAEIQYREVMAMEARINGLPPPVFPESLTDFGDAPPDH